MLKYHIFTILLLIANSTFAQMPLAGSQMWVPIITHDASMSTFDYNEADIDTLQIALPFAYNRDQNDNYQVFGGFCFPLFSSFSLGAKAMYKNQSDFNSLNLSITPIGNFLSAIDNWHAAVALTYFEFERFGSTPIIEKGQYKMNLSATRKFGKIEKYNSKRLFSISASLNNIGLSPKKSNYPISERLNAEFLLAYSYQLKNREIYLRFYLSHNHILVEDNFHKFYSHFQIEWNMPIVSLGSGLMYNSIYTPFNSNAGDIYLNVSLKLNLFKSLHVYGSYTPNQKIQEVGGIWLPNRILKSSKVKSEKIPLKNVIDPISEQIKPKNIDIDSVKTFQIQIASLEETVKKFFNTRPYLPDVDDEIYVSFKRVQEKINQLNEELNITYKLNHKEQEPIRKRLEELEKVVQDIQSSINIGKLYDKTNLQNRIANNSTLNDFFEHKSLEITSLEHESIQQVRITYEFDDIDSLLKIKETPLGIFASNISELLKEVSEPNNYYKKNIKEIKLICSFRNDNYLNDNVLGVSLDETLPAILGCVDSCDKRYEMAMDMLRPKQNKRDSSTISHKDLGVLKLYRLRETILKNCSHLIEEDDILFCIKKKVIKQKMPRRITIVIILGK